MLKLVLHKRSGLVAKKLKNSSHQYGAVAFMTDEADWTKSVSFCHKLIFRF